MLLQFIMETKPPSADRAGGVIIDILMPAYAYSAILDIPFTSPISSILKTISNATINPATI